MDLRTTILVLSVLPTLLGAAALPQYQTVPLPPGQMTLEVPLNTYLQTDYIAVTVTVGVGLRIGRYGVTNREWNACFQAGGCARKADVRPDEGPDNPVVRVNWHEAAQFARWLSETTGRHYRLPTEQEWYYVFNLGKDYKIQSRQFNYSDLDQVRKVPKKTWPRGKFGENAWGVADMVGNVWEWTLSCYTLSRTRLQAAPDIAALESADACSTRVVGGENCAHVPDFLRDTYSGGCGTLEPAANLGFRLVEEVLP